MEQMVFDRSILETVIEGKRWPRTRVLVNKEGRAVAWAEQNGSLLKIGDAVQAQVGVMRAGRKWTVGEWVCTKSGSCGCGSPLKRLKSEEAFR